MQFSNTEFPMCHSSLTVDRISKETLENCTTVNFGFGYFWGLNGFYLKKLN